MTNKNQVKDPGAAAHVLVGAGLFASLLWAFDYYIVPDTDFLMGYYIIAAWIGAAVGQRAHYYEMQLKSDEKEDNGATLHKHTGIQKD